MWGQVIAQNLGKNLWSGVYKCAPQWRKIWAELEKRGKCIEVRQSGKNKVTAKK